MTPRFLAANLAFLENLMGEEKLEVEAGERSAESLDNFDFYY